MDSFNNELQQTLQGKFTLRRTPAPKPPGNKDDNQPGGEFFSIKLKPVGTNHNESKPVHNHKSTGIENASNNNQEGKPRPQSIQDISKLFENGSPGKPTVPHKPGVAKKPVTVPKPVVADKPVAVNASSAQNKEIKRTRPPSVMQKPV